MLTMMYGRSTLISIMVIIQWVGWCLDCTERRFPRWVELLRAFFLDDDQLTDMRDTQTAENFRYGLN